MDVCAYVELYKNAEAVEYYTGKQTSCLDARSAASGNEDIFCIAFVLLQSSSCHSGSQMDSQRIRQKERK